MYTLTSFLNMPHKVRKLLQYTTVNIELKAKEQYIDENLHPFYKTLNNGNLFYFIVTGYCKIIIYKIILKVLELFKNLFEYFFSGLAYFTIMKPSIYFHIWLTKVGLRCYY